MPFIKRITDPSLSEVKFLRKPSLLYINGEIDQALCDTFVTDLEKCIQSNQTHLLVYIDSEGGDVYCARKIIECLLAAKQAGLTVVSVVLQKAFSAASLIYSYGDIRYISPTGSIMVHDVSVELLSGNACSVINEGREMERLQTHFYENIERNCGLEKDILFNLVHVKNKGSDYYVPAEEAIKMKLAHHIGVPTATLEVSVSFTVNFPHEHTKKRKNCS